MTGKHDSFQVLKLRSRYPYPFQFLSSPSNYSSPSSQIHFNFFIQIFLAVVSLLPHPLSFNISFIYPKMLFVGRTFFFFSHLGKSSVTMRIHIPNLYSEDKNHFYLPGPNPSFHPCFSIVPHEPSAQKTIEISYCVLRCALHFPMLHFCLS